VNLGSTYQLGLSPVSTWPSSVSTLNQNSNGAGWEIGAYVFPIPTASAVAISGTGTVGSTLTGSYTYSDPAGNAQGVSTFRWLRASTSGGSYSSIGGATATTHVLTTADIGKYLEFEVTPVSTLATGSAAVSSPTAQINSSGVPTASSVSITGTVTEGQTLTGNYTYAQADGVVQGVSTFRWLEAASSGGSYSAIGGATASTYALAAADVGKYIKFEVTPVASYPPTTGVAVQSSSVGAVTPSSLPVASAVSISGTQSVGNTLTGSYTYTDSGGHAESGSTFRWLESATSGGTYSAISGATAKTYTLASSDIGKYIEFEVTPISTVATGVAVDSSPSGQINSSGVPTASSVSISGTPAIGQTLTGSYTYAQADGVSEGASTFRWLESTSPSGSFASISGATNQTYTISNNEYGMYFEFEVTPVATIPPTTGSPTVSAPTLAHVPYPGGGAPLSGPMSYGYVNTNQTPTPVTTTNPNKITLLTPAQAANPPASSNTGITLTKNRNCLGSVTPIQTGAADSSGRRNRFPIQDLDESRTAVRAVPGRTDCADQVTSG
jgi:hypothetical protein